MKLVGNILTTLLTRLTILALALVSSMLMARLLGPEGIGLFALVLLVPDLLRNFGLFGMDQANVVYAGLEPESRRALVWQSIIVAGVLGSTIALAGIAFFVLGAPGSQRLVHGPLWLYLLPLAIVPGALLADCWGSIIRGMNHIVLLNALDVGTKVASLALVVAFVGWLRLNVSGAVWAGTIVDVAAVLMMAFLLRRLKIWGKPSFDWSLWKRTARLALPVI